MLCLSMEQIGHKHIYEDYSRFELKDLSPMQLQERLLADLQPYTDYETRAQISASFNLADYLHRDRFRSPGPYIEHPLRNANRIVTYFGIRDPEIVQAALLHDTVEDHAREMAELARIEVETEEEAREVALAFIADLFGERVRDIVSGVTTPLYDGPKDGKNEFYRAHVKEAIKDQDVFIVKLADFFDNAVGLHHTENDELVRRLSHKYEPLYDVFRERLENPDLPFDDETRGYIDAKLAKGHVKNAEHMAA